MLDPSLDRTVPAVVARARMSQVRALGPGLDRSLALLAGLSLASQLIVSTMLPVVPLFATELGATPGQLALMVVISALAVAAGQLLGGVASDRLGARRLLPAGLAIYGVASLLTPSVGAVSPVVALRGLTGLGSGANIVGERLYCRQIVDRGRLAFANGLVQAAGAVGLVIGPMLGGVVADALDLGAAFLLAGVASLAVALAALFLPARIRADSAASPAASVIVPVERRGLWILFFANAAFAAGFGSFITTFAPVAADRLGWTITETGLAFALFGLGNVAIGPWLASVADRRGRRFVGALATIPNVALALALVLAAPDVPLYLLALLAGGGTAGFTSAWLTLLGLATGGARGGKRFGAIAGISSLGIVVGAVAAGRLWETIDIRAGMLVTVVAMALAGGILAAYREGRDSSRSAGANVG